MKYRLNRALASTGLCSRRRADELIAQGMVRLNGKVVTDFNLSVDLTSDKLEVDGQKLTVKYFEYILLYKPEGVITTCNDERGRKNVLELLPKELRHLRPVGRLDMDSQGLIILTNDGELAQHLAHPSHQVYKRYEVTVDGEISEESLSKMRNGIRLKDGPTLPAVVDLLTRNKQSSRIQISIKEGRNRQIRRMCAQLGHTVIRLVRVAIGELQLRQMQPGEWRRLTAQEVETLRSK